MISAFGVDHGTVNKALSPGQIRGLTAVKRNTRLSPQRVEYAQDRLMAARGGKATARAGRKYEKGVQWHRPRSREALSASQPTSFPNDMRDVTNMVRREKGVPVPSGVGMRLHGGRTLP